MKIYLSFSINTGIEKCNLNQTNHFLFDLSDLLKSRDSILKNRQIEPKSNKRPKTAKAIKSAIEPKIIKESVSCESPLKR